MKKIQEVKYKKDENGKDEEDVLAPGTTLILPKGIQWMNQYNWQPIRRVADISVTGKMILWEHELINGRKIILSSPKESGWWTEANVSTLTAIASMVGATFRFTWDSFVSKVVFDYTDGNAIELEKVLPNYTYYFGTVKLLCV